MDKNLVAAAVLKEQIRMLNEFQVSGFTHFRDAWLSCDMLLDRQVQASIGSELVLGKYKGVDRDGAALLETDAGPMVLSGGEISVRAST